MEKIYIHPRYMELCVCITDYDDMQKRELKDFWQLFCVLRDDSHFRNNIPRTYETKKKFRVFNVRDDNCMKSEEKLAPADCCFLLTVLWGGVSESSYCQTQCCSKCLPGSLFPKGRVVQDSRCCTKPNTMFRRLLLWNCTIQNTKAVHLVLLLWTRREIRVHGEGHATAAFTPGKRPGNVCTGA
jgi:hypothetical protein